MPLQRRLLNATDTQLVTTPLEHNESHPRQARVAESRFPAAVAVRTEPRTGNPRRCPALPQPGPIPLSIKQRNILEDRD